MITISKVKINKVSEGKIDYFYFSFNVKREGEFNESVIGNNYRKESRAKSELEKKLSKYGTNKIIID